MNPNQAKALQSERITLKTRLEESNYGGMTPREDRSRDAKRLKEINKLLNDWYLKK